MRIENAFKYIRNLMSESNSNTPQTQPFNAFSSSTPATDSVSFDPFSFLNLDLLQSPFAPTSGLTTDPDLNALLFGVNEDSLLFVSPFTDVNQSDMRVTLKKSPDPVDQNLAFLLDEADRLAPDGVPSDLVTTRNWVAEQMAKVTA